MEFQMSGEDFRDMGLANPSRRRRGRGRRPEMMGAGFFKRMARKVKNVAKDATHVTLNAGRAAADSKLVRDVAGATAKAAMPHLAAMDLAKKLIPSSVRKAGNDIAANMPKAKPVAALPKIPRGKVKQTAGKAVAAFDGMSMPAKVGIGVGVGAALLLAVKAMSGKPPAA